MTNMLARGAAILPFLLIAATSCSTASDSSSKREDAYLAVMNGDALETATTHWEAIGGCNNGQENFMFSRDGRLRYYNKTYGDNVTYTWEKLNAYSLLVALVADSGPGGRLTQVANINGSISLGQFKALSLHKDGGNANCSYTLVAGKLMPN
jgi:hypothetical protein